ncbi:MAG: hypothetical protein IKT55_00815 [Clostridia bacterium]|nr:hypothetical protein [Clostridia bacterium]
MISKAYEKADFEIVEFSLEDVLTNSSVITTAPTEPGTTLPGASIGGGSQVTVPWSDFFQ